MSRYQPRRKNLLDIYLLINICFYIGTNKQQDINSELTFSLPGLLASVGRGLGLLPASFGGGGQGPSLADGGNTGLGGGETGFYGTRSLLGYTESAYKYYYNTR